MVTTENTLAGVLEIPRHYTFVLPEKMNVASLLFDMMVELVAISSFPGYNSYR